MPYKILEKKELGKSGVLFEIILSTPLIAKKAHAGNFILLRINETGERFPLTIADYDRDEGTITIVFQVVGKSTKQLSHLNIGDEILDVVGPLGNKIHIQKYEHPVILIGGGVGIAPIYPQAKELKEAGNTVICILGARNTDLLFWREKLRSVSDELIICTDDGTEGIKGVVTEPLKNIIIRRKISIVVAIGPLIMMKYVARTTDGSGDLPKVKTYASLNTIMIDGTGMCGGCRFTTVQGEIYHSCVDGPDVDAHMVDFDNLLNRATRFVDQEKESLEQYEDECRALNKFKNEGC
ncbi:MAG: sulfide/dihydroorotate dehydrogenase-like FAD/NAD-binding protein [Candidatus Lokiarchaeota archaeon]|nr:sulfide/dihydroorotate dehydrogenase-like FAD/NAD-binding protein [Candidatus Lokiarchaeota archaeon]